MYLKFFSLLFFSLTSWSMVVIDVRTEDEWKTGHLDGAINIEWQDILKISSTYKKDEERIDVKNKKGECFRIDRYCPHQKADLCNAQINEDNYLICPVHAWKFDLNNGGKDKRSKLSINSRRR